MFFARQCSIRDNGSGIPFFLHPKTDKSLSSITFTEKDIEKIMQNLDSNKPHGYDIISIRMLKICNKSLIRLLLIIYKKCLENGCLPKEWKKANAAPVHKKWKTATKNYWSIFLLKICSKALVRLPYNSMFEFFIHNNLITVLRQVTREWTNLFPSLRKYANHLMMAMKYQVYLLIYWKHLTKYSTKVVKLRQNCLSSKLLHTLTDFLNNKTWRVIING